MEDYSRNLVGETSKQFADTSHLFRSTNPAFGEAADFALSLHSTTPVNRVEPDFYDPEVVAFETGWRQNERRGNVVVTGHPSVMEMVTSRNSLVPFKGTYLSLDRETGSPRPVTEYSHRICQHFNVEGPASPSPPVDSEGYVRPRKEEGEIDSPWYLLGEDTPKRERYDEKDRPADFDLKAGFAAALMAMLLVFPAMG